MQKNISYTITDIVSQTSLSELPLRIYPETGVGFLAMEDFCQLDLRLTQDNKNTFQKITIIYKCAAI